MDSLSQIVLGSALTIGVMGRRTAVWKAALWGGVCGTLPDLDSFINFGDAVRNMTYHRAESHSLFYLTLISLPIAWAVSRLHAESQHFKYWLLGLWLALFTHPLLDTMTVYGTQLLQPFSDYPFAIGSIFIIDPIYTLPLLIGCVCALVVKNAAGLRWNIIGIVLSTTYLLWSAVVQIHVHSVAKESLLARGINTEKILVTPSPFNTLLWRIVVMREGGFEEGYFSLFDRERKIRFDRFTIDAALYESLKDVWAVDRMAWFTRGFFKMQIKDDKALLTDLRMGQEPHYVFSFAVAERQSPTFAAITPESVGSRGNLSEGFSWLWTRLRGNDVPSPK
jgi:inner membrane protein